MWLGIYAGIRAANLNFDEATGGASNASAGMGYYFGHFGHSRLRGVHLPARLRLLRTVR